MNVCIVGAGVTGLAAGIASGAPVFEKADGPGGLCRSYYMRAGDPTRYERAPSADDAYRFEAGGGHWIFGGDAEVEPFLSDLAPFRTYERRAGLRLDGIDGIDGIVPYPLQAHTRYLGPALAGQIASEIKVLPATSGEGGTMRDWLLSSFGNTLCGLFFFPFNDRYTAGLSSTITPQDSYKTPVAGSVSSSAGYNAKFRYPVGGLDRLVGAMAERCDVFYERELTRIDGARRVLGFADGAERGYDRVISTLPLNRIVELAGLALAARPDPFTSTLVLNIAAERAERCPDVHWLYEACSRSGFHRVGFYSNVDEDFLPASARRGAGNVSMYVEWAFPGGARPAEGEVARLAESTTTELRERGYIGGVHNLDASWVEVAYTWSLPGSGWRAEAIAALRAIGVHQAGRYGRWRFQGIADSIREGLEIGRSIAAADAAPLRT